MSTKTKKTSGKAKATKAKPSAQKPEAATAKVASNITKADIIREALAASIESPSAISAFAKEKHGVDISPQYASIIKSQIMARAGGTSVRGRNVQGNAAMLFSLKCGSIDKAKAAVEKLNGDATMAFAIACGGADRAIAMLDSLTEQLAT